MMPRSSWLMIVVAAGLAVIVLSFVEGWIIYDRIQRGEGYRYAQISLSAWRSVALPVLTIAVLVAAVTSFGAAVALRQARIPAWLLAIGAGLALGLIGASVVPMGIDRHATTVDLSPGWLIGVGIILAAVMVVAALVAAGAGPRLVAATVVVGVAGLGVGLGGRWIGLQQAVGSNQQWEEGSYTRPAGEGVEALTLTITDGWYQIGDRWAGRWENFELTVVVDDDPACPGSRGTYHAHAAGDDGRDLRFVKIVDTCEAGARADALETGIWERDP